MIQVPKRLVNEGLLTNAAALYTLLLTDEREDKE
jgi:hypothetical protein